MLEDAIRKYGLIILLSALGFQMVFSEGGVLACLLTWKDARTVNASIASIEKENKLLLKEIDRLQKDDQYLENVVRTRYGFVREGEKLYRIEK
ncbi:MAG: septum formation initiator family protein [Syntrophobacterales bacterium]|jgi:cell division protein FtsB|nr:septum formation initiator family protein [Syntrophobacterales bacterium]